MTHDRISTKSWGVNQMCDTFYVKSSKDSGGTAFFAKNSDRDPNEPQCMLFIPKGSISEPGTYVKLPAYEVKNDVWLSKPSWMWGAEMGINSKEVCIGNEATFNKVPAEKNGVLGMDYLRMALEQASTAFEAMNIIIESTLSFGQGGDGGYEHPLFYHNSYLLVDPKEAYVLETVGKYYAFKKLQGSYNISNKLSLGNDFDGISPELEGKVKNFQTYFTNRLVTYFAGAAVRERRGRELLSTLVPNVVNVMALLQDRGTGAVYSMKNINMIGGGLVSSQTTASLIYDYERKIIWFTEGPDPEMQVFKPLNFNVPATIEDEEVQLRQGVRRWKWNNLLFRAALKDYSVNKDKTYPLRLESQRALLDLSVAENGADKLLEQSYAINQKYLKEALGVLEKGPVKGSWQFKRYWSAENRRLIAKETDSAFQSLLKQFLL
ncbi:MAG TPA: secernin [Coprothermobacter proteolyticus]|nr:secernin [Coprothermobacter proteolyticus]